MFPREAMVLGGPCAALDAPAPATVSRWASLVSLERRAGPSPTSTTSTSGARRARRFRAAQRAQSESVSVSSVHSCDTCALQQVQSFVISLANRIEVFASQFDDHSSLVSRVCLLESRTACKPLHFDISDSRFPVPPSLDWMDMNDGRLQAASEGHTANIQSLKDDLYASLAGHKEEHHRELSALLEEHTATLLGFIEKR